MGLGKRRIADRGKVIKFNPIPIATVLATISIIGREKKLIFFDVSDHLEQFGRLLFFLFFCWKN